ncbi:hypothetical protein V5F32_00745 [Xanthobacter oligotrophicus]|uniref:Uncharacterized protein n=1 Tax=Xanthobacter oligotrophicus TaxID=2607286 RepID=A0ABW6ZPN0_9HYPH
MTTRYRDGFALASLALRRRGGVAPLRTTVNGVTAERLRSTKGEYLYLTSADGSPLYGRVSDAVD